MATVNAKQTGCATCLKMQERYQQNPRSLMLKLWKWHTGWCPGWKANREAERKAAAQQAALAIMSNPDAR